MLLEVDACEIVDVVDRRDLVDCLGLVHAAFRSKPGEREKVVEIFLCSF